MANIQRVALIVLDALGAGAQADSAKYGDEGANTLKHVLEAGKPDIPNLTELGLLDTIGMGDEDEPPIGNYGTLQAKAAGKDTTTGHWEIAGLTLEEPFPTFPNGFPAELIKEFERESGMQVIGNRAASGTGRFSSSYTGIRFKN